MNLRTTLFLLLTLPVFAQPQFDRLASEQFQKQLDKEYQDEKESPLLPEDRAVFKGHPFFPIDAKYFVVAEFVRAENEKPFGMKTSTARLPMYVKYGEIRFTIDGKTCKLNVYQNVELVKKEGFQDYLFLPFSDATNGDETYIGGRYIDVRIPKNNVLAIDFNQAYNPYCAYNHKYSCPAVPQENVLEVAIRAGVKKFHD